jgi:plasmid stability protein
MKAKVMAQLTVRNVPDAVVRALRLRAAKHGRSAEAEHRVILDEMLRPAGDADFWARADARRSRSRRQRWDSAALQREMRDQR